MFIGTANMVHNVLKMFANNGLKVAHADTKRAALDLSDHTVFVKRYRYELRCRLC